MSDFIVTLKSGQQFATGLIAPPAVRDVFSRLPSEESSGT